MAKRAIASRKRAIASRQCDCRYELELLTSTVVLDRVQRLLLYASSIRSRQSACGSVRQSSGARGRRECRTKRSRTKMASGTIEVVRRTKKARKIGILRGRMRIGRNYLNPSEFPTDGPRQPIQTFVTYSSRWRPFRRSCVALSGHHRPLALRPPDRWGRLWRLGTYR